MAKLPSAGVQLNASKLESVLDNDGIEREANLYEYVVAFGPQLNITFCIIRRNLPTSFFK